MNERFDPVPFITFVRGFLFWAAATAAMGYIPLFIGSMSFSTTQAAIFLSGTAIGRVIFQPIMGKLISPKNCLQVYASALIGLVLCSFFLFFSSSVGLLLVSRLLEGAFFSGFIISWRTQLNQLSQYPNFDSVNDSYVLSQNAGRLIGPIAGGFIVEKFNIHSVFLFSAILYLLCMMILPRKIAATSDIDNLNKHTGIKYFQFFRHDWKLLLIHHLEFICLGLWLTSWPIFAVYSCEFDPINVGYSFAISAAGGLLMLPIRQLLRKITLKVRLTMSLILLFLQPTSAIFMPNNLGFWIMFLLGGLGSTIYFTTFHKFISKTYSVEKIPVIYGILGTSTFLAQAFGHAAVPYLQKFGGIDTPIIINVIFLLVMMLISLKIPKKNR
ncbi:MFS transporter [Xenorhabdus bovienii]|uniref:MFS transporter n=1 Tax=Xenorhabdus bovienii TaxID=40576 RepID=UPI00237CF0D9|nr:MFS transporter [Xenorhabdus bovienii]MDE1474741.1 MFS transporter [Xenorhabdus bovienii]MDE1482068.1 MFS transporter [Xenorhabdus bovienii]MDE9433527.1 MFS transporter [Xenorhabdus bovienii]MDE9442995.1 MFS transporter [Xenorhabdus bovienii]MDE9459554.1 MFS transporter [Xenorhabdus bovienii]